MARPPVTAEPDEAAEAAPAKKSKKKLFIIIGALVVLLGGAAAWFFTQSDGAPKDAEAKPQQPPVYLALDTFTVNLQEGERYMQVDVTLQVADQAQADAIKLHMPRVRSRLLALLSSKHAEALTTAADKQALAQEILAQVKLPFDAQAKPQQVDDVLFTSFVIQ
ncbi:MAG: flagellar basal body-associated protein FliL [Thiobacillus sp.]|nr:MAG: flagellar basal body-associated protein FliL [Hydrogenophilales bacterium 16-64-40]OZA33736.1 MAG: flagellar basal body-associated protein FliL [Hydrogenophilales bacterium 17-64-65]HQT34168.1 flagellar basal body-associated protein FliL [Thiobacillus sp.]